MLSLNLFLLFALNEFSLAEQCKNKQITTVDGTGNVFRVDCPPNCSLCLLSTEKKVDCFFCDEGFYFREGNCNPCALGCAKCIGPNVSDCSELLHQYFYNETDNIIQKCIDDGCSTCTPSGTCLSCATGYYEVQIGNELTCKQCHIPNCLYCGREEDDIKNINYVVCRLCEAGYGFVGSSCQKCPENCAICHHNAKDCLSCIEGYYINRSEGRCKPFSDPNCRAADENGKCILCASQFYIDQGQCIPCAARSENCAYCSIEEGNVVCDKCAPGYRDSDNRTCVACPPNCVYCTEDFCLSCDPRKIWDSVSKACVPCLIENCKECIDANLCRKCEIGYFFDKEAAKCVRCQEHCITCSSDGLKCHSCPLGYYSFETALPNHNRQTLSSFFSHVFEDEYSLPPDSFDDATHCVKSCPEVFEGYKVIINETKKTCFLRGEAWQNSIDRPVPANNTLSAVMALNANYKKEIKSFERNSQPEGESPKSSRCNYRGTLHREMRGDFDSYYVCRCDEHVLGDSCEIPIRLYAQMQTQIIKILDDVQREHFFSDAIQKPTTLKALINITSFKISLPTLHRLISVLRRLRGSDKDIENKTQLYTLYDGILVSAFDQGEDLKKEKRLVSEIDKDAEAVAEGLDNCIVETIRMIEGSLELHTYANSFLERGNSKYTVLHNYAFMFSEERLSDYSREGEFRLGNPNIDTSFHTTDSVRITMEFANQSAVENSRFHLQLVNYSVMLFTELWRNKHLRIPSNVIYVRLIDTEQLYEPISWTKVGITVFRIHFNLLYLPTINDPFSRLKCEASDLRRERVMLTGALEALDEDARIATCRFEAIDDPVRHYFSLSYSKG